MVDFNSVGTMSKPPKEVVALIIIEKLYNFLEADEKCTETRLNGATLGTAVLRARLRGLFLVSHRMLERRIKKPKDFERVENVCMNLKGEFEDSEIMEAYIIILKVLDDMRLIKLDTKPQYNRHRVEEANKQHGY